MCVFFCSGSMYAQQSQSAFWDRVSYGGSLGINFGSGYFSGNVAPSAIYEFNPYFSAGPGLSFGYVKNDFYRSSLAGASLIALVNPYRYIQFSAELEEVYASQKYENSNVAQTREFWNTALFLG
ncbi:hypothetical protein [Flavimarina sp. Hel_I_48]|uniref:hypothetical protein n=1 Tax=Flavimarina sp. Hel_I_48 TaxID=1392488 RepID=UPI00068BEFED|nr:hypothetical protein [Flavimarina sp. Hel_I_48]